VKFFVDTASIEEIKKAKEQLINHPLTDIGLEKFLADWREMEKP
jgi:transaldolase